MAIPNGTASDAIDDTIDYSDLEEKFQVVADESFDNIVVLDGVPVIDNSRREKLLIKVSKEFAKRGSTITPNDIIVPWDDAIGKSKGYLFMEFRTRADAEFAINAMDNVPFDAKHTFRLNHFLDVEKYTEMDPTYVEPELEAYKPGEHLRAWLADPQGRDQYVTYRGDEVTVNWHGKPSQCEAAHTRVNWTNLYVSWSPQGTYLATLHRQGVCLWAGTSWELRQRFAHPLVKLIDFSPNDNYLVTWSQDPVVVPDGSQQGPNYFSMDDQGNNVAVWDIKTGHLLRTFLIESDDKKQLQWPALKWSADEKYVARTTPGQQISVYELPSMGLQAKKSLKIEGVVDFEWCPHGDKDKEEVEKASKSGKPGKVKENMLAYWTPEVSNQPARVTVINFPTRSVLRQKNLFNVSDCKLHWQNQGDFLCVKVDRHTKTKKSIFCNLEIFQVRDKDFPVEVVEHKDTVLDFSWEPRGERFAIVSSSDPNVGNPGPGITIKTDISFYQLERSKGDFKLLRTLTSRTSNTIRWSPRGRHVVLATVGSSTKSELEFWDLDFNTEDGKKEGAGDSSGIQALGTADHYGVTDVEWDPSGRYLATSASAWRHTLENGYAIWDFRGQELQKHILDRFKQFLWRPRPRTLLTKDQQRQIRRNLREYSRVFDEEDAAEETNVSAELIAHRKRLVDEWNTWRAQCEEEIGDRRKGRRAERRGEEIKEEIEVWVDEVIEQIEEVLE